MHGKCLLIASPLAVALVFGTVDISQASAVPTSVSVGDSYTMATLKVTPPVCSRSFKGKLKKLCSNGWSEGYTAGIAACKNKEGFRSLSPALQDAAYIHGFNAGFSAGKTAC
ncbi:hypothetical protein ACSDR0_50350 [Streptosporangium sp. G11]|uniref:hypothetical protein n=1 Tax=Streptosporangium sp. G11 TaxID=3436926 RepID=UPI003EB8D2F7